MTLDNFLDPTNLIGMITVVINGIMIRLNYKSSKRQIKSVAILNNRQQEIDIIRDNIKEILALSNTILIYKEHKVSDFILRIEQISILFENLNLFLNNEIEEEKKLLTELGELRNAIANKEAEDKITKCSKNIRLLTKKLLSVHKDIVLRL